MIHYRTARIDLAIGTGTGGHGERRHGRDIKACAHPTDVQRDGADGSGASRGGLTHDHSLRVVDRTGDVGKRPAIDGVLAAGAGNADRRGGVDVQNAENLCSHPTAKFDGVFGLRPYSGSPASRHASAKAENTSGFTPTVTEKRRMVKFGLSFSTD